MKKTKYFQNVLGVFQGGGCKGSAYVGVYQALMSRGVSFSGVVGTSVGSIIATLISAGATPQQLSKAIKSLDFKKFIGEPKKINEYTPVILPQPVRIAMNYYKEKSDYVKHAIPFLNFLGLHSSDYIKEWIETVLLQVLGKNQGPVLFRDLKIPLHIICSDLKTQKVKTWSTLNNQENEVSSAVQKSCNMPLFFQPIEMRYVDGGLLSNLPAFIFKDEADKLYNRILAFNLKSEIVNKEINNIEAYLKSLVNTTLDGNLDIQLSMINNLNVIDINTGDISATDFDKITPEKVEYLIGQGQKATEDFLDDEPSLAKNSSKRNDVTKDLFNTNNYIIESVEYSNGEIFIVETNTSFVYSMFPTLLKWILDDCKIKIILQENTDKPDHSAYRRRFLISLGIQIVEVTQIPFRGYIFNGDSKDFAKAIILNKYKDDDNKFYSKYYYGEEDFDVIRSLRSHLLSTITIAENTYQPSVSKVDRDELIEKLRTVPQYSDDKVTMVTEDIEVEEVYFITRFVKVLNTVRLSFYLTFSKKTI